MRSDFIDEMRSVLPEGVRGVAKVEHYRIPESSIRLAMLQPRSGLAYTDPNKTYTKLTVKGALMMSDTRMERITNIGVLQSARGDVLIAGLGIGLIVHPIAAKKDTRSITVIEKYQDVIDLVAPSLPAGVTVICADIFTWRPAKGTKYDTIYFDIWPDQCTDNLEEMARLHQAFKGFKRSKDSFMDSWFRETLKAMKREESRAWW